MSVQKSKTALFSRERTELAEVELDLENMVETYTYFREMQLEDSELKIPTYRAKIPLGDGRAFDIVTGEDGYNTSVTSFRGVVANFHNYNALFTSPEPGNDPPVCSSPDGIKGLDVISSEIMDCASCPNNQWGSGNGSRRGKACKNMRRLYILVEGADMPLVMTLPPTSIAGWEMYKSAVLGVRRLSPKEVVTEFALSSAINGAENKYSVVVFKAVGVISSEAREMVEYLGSGETYDKDVVAEDYNIVDNTALAEDEAEN